TPIISIMLRAVALPTPIPRMRGGRSLVVGRRSWAKTMSFTGNRVTWRNSGCHQKIPQAPNRDQRPTTVSVSRAQQVHIQANCSRHTRGQLAEEGVAGINVCTLAVVRSQ